MVTKKTEDSDADETVVYVARLHWAMVLPPFLLLTFAGLSIPSKGLHAWVLVAISLAWIAFSAKIIRAKEYRLTEDHLVMTTDFPWRRSFRVPFASVKGADIYQPTLGKILDFGRVRIIMKDGSNRYLRMVKAPMKLAEKINEFSHFSLDSASS